MPRLVSVIAALGAAGLVALGAAPAASAAPAAGTPRVLTVATTGRDAGNNCTDAASPCLTIAHAVGQARPGDIVKVGAGTFREDLFVAKPLTITGQSEAATNIVPEAQVDGAGDGIFIADQASNVTVSNLTITGTAGVLDTAIINAGAALTVGNVTVRKTGFGITAVGGSTTISGSTFRDNAFAVIKDSGDLTVDDSVIDDSGLTPAAQEDFFGLAFGVGAFGGGVTDVGNTVIRGADVGVAAEGVGDPNQGPIDVAIQNSSITGSADPGVLAAGNSMSIDNSTISGNGAANVFAISGTVTITRSTITAVHRAEDTPDVANFPPAAGIAAVPGDQLDEGGGSSSSSSSSSSYVGPASSAPESIPPVSSGPESSSDTTSTGSTTTSTEAEPTTTTSTATPDAQPGAVPSLLSAAAKAVNRMKAHAQSANHAPRLPAQDDTTDPTPDTIDTTSSDTSSTDTTSVNETSADTITVESSGATTGSGDTDTSSTGPTTDTTDQTSASSSTIAPTPSTEPTATVTAPATVSSEDSGADDPISQESGGATDVLPTYPPLKVSVQDTVIDSGAAGPDCYGTITDAGYNLSADKTNSCRLSVAAASHINTDPMLGALTFNAAGAAWQTPDNASPLIDVIPIAESLCTAGAGDQRGISRPQGDGCDIGAIEKVLTPIVITPDQLPDGQVGVHYRFALHATGGAGARYQFTTATTAPLPSGLTISHDGVIAGSPTVAGSFTVTVSVNDPVTKTYTLTIRRQLASTGPGPVAGLVGGGALVLVAGAMLLAVTRRPRVRN